MKSIVLVTSYPINAEPVIRNRLQPYIEVLVKNNFEVTLISGDSAPPEFDFNYKFNYKYVPKPDVQGKGFFARAVQEFKHAGMLLNEANRHQKEYVLLTIPSMFLLFRSKIIKHPKRILDVRDLTWEYLSSEKRIFRFIKRKLSIKAKGVFRNFDFVTVTNNTEYSKMSNFYNLSEEKLHLLPNGVSREQFKLLSNTSPSESIRKTVCYIGNIGLAQNLTLLASVAKKLPEVNFLLVGGGNDFNRVREYVSRNQIDNIEMTGRVSWESIPDYYEQADILYAQLGADYQGAMPSKLYEYLSTGKYIVYGGGAQAADVLTDFDNNAVIPPDSKEELYAAIFEALNIVSEKYLSTSNRSKIEKRFIREDNIELFVSKLREMK